MTEDQETLEKLILCNKEEAHLKVIIGCSPKTLCIIPIDAPVVQNTPPYLILYTSTALSRLASNHDLGYVTDTSGTPRNYGEGDDATTDSVLEPCHPEPHLDHYMDLTSLQHQDPMLWIYRTRTWRQARRHWTTLAILVAVI